MTTTVDDTAPEAGKDAHPSSDDRFALVDKHLKRVRYEQDQLIETLHIAQDVFGYLSEDVLMYVARALLLPPSMVYGVATFYQLFTFEAPGDHACTVCTGTACFVKGADAIVRTVGDAYSVAAGATSDDGKLTLNVYFDVGTDVDIMQVNTQNRVGQAQAQHVDLLTWLPGQMLVKTDRTSMASASTGSSLTRICSFTRFSARWPIRL